MFSYWEQNTFLDDADIVIIGSGIVGLSAAVELADRFPTKRITILERGTLPKGASTKNAGFACFGSVTELLDDLRTTSEEEVFQLVKKRWQGLKKLRNVVGNDRMDFKLSGGHELFLDADESLFQMAAEKIEYLNLLMHEVTGNTDVFEVNDSMIPSTGMNGLHHLISNRYEGSLNPGKMMQALLHKAEKLGVQILNGVEVTGLETLANGHLVRTDQFSLRCGRIIVANNGFATGLLKELAVRPARNQVIVTNVLEQEPPEGTYHYDKGYIYFRDIDGRLLIGGARNLDFEKEGTSEMAVNEDIIQYLETFARETILPNRDFHIEYQWTGIMGVGEVKTPIVKQVREGLFTAVRLGGMGIAIGYSVGEDVAQQVAHTL